MRSRLVLPVGYVCYAVYRLLPGYGCTTTLFTLHLPFTVLPARTAFYSAISTTPYTFATFGCVTALHFAGHYRTFVYLVYRFCVYCRLHAFVPHTLPAYLVVPAPRTRLLPGCYATRFYVVQFDYGCRRLTLHYRLRFYAPVTVPRTTFWFRFAATHTHIRRLTYTRYWLRLLPFCVTTLRTLPFTRVYWVLRLPRTLPPTTRLIAFSRLVGLHALHTRYPVTHTAWFCIPTRSSPFTPLRTPPLLLLGLVPVGFTLPRTCTLLPHVCTLPCVHAVLYAVTVRVLTRYCTPVYAYCHTVAFCGCTRFTAHVVDWFTHTALPHAPAHLYVYITVTARRGYVVTVRMVLHCLYVTRTHVATQHYRCPATHAHITRIRPVYHTRLGSVRLPLLLRVGSTLRFGSALHSLHTTLWFTLCPTLPTFLTTVPLHVAHTRLDRILLPGSAVTVHTVSLLIHTFGWFWVRFCSPDWFTAHYSLHTFPF